jgi:hypothetical protein
MGGKRNEYRLLVRKPEGKRPLGRSRRRCVDNVKLDIAEIVWVDVDWTALAQEQVESSCECGDEPSGSKKCCETIEWPSNWWSLE